MTNYHEPANTLSNETRDFVRALNSLKEEVEAVDWYQQRVDASSSAELKAIMAHNRDEEIEHACMTLEWLRRNMDGWDEQLRTYLFTSAPILEVEEAAESEDDASESSDKDLNIGNMK
ncbi:encapsulin-associated ferritin-like protein [Fusibacter sp. JL216-2]|uniref:encapsulin-associated ferritin-like protein n=1 Tax=Fusibacter sp. JL216-2 TaxID=3071453 RepID=UPI003D329F5C